MNPTPGSRDGAITVVIPTRDRAALLEQTLRSLAEQSLAPAQTIVVDDGSSDDTAALLARSEVVAIRNPGPAWGPARARNEGLDRATGELVCFLDSDDLLVPDALATLLEAVERRPQAPFAFGTALAARRGRDGWHPDGLIGPDDGELGDLLCSIFARNSVPSPAALVRRDAALAVGGYDGGVPWAEDQHFWVRLAQRAQPVHVPRLAAIYRLHDGARHYSPAIASAGSDPFMALAASDPRLARCLPERLGVQLAEIAPGALRAGQPRVTAAALWHGLATRRDRAAIARRAWRHRTARRGWHQAGVALWDSSPDLRAWLDSY